MQHIKENLQRIRSRIDNAATSVGRDPQDIKLLLATKTVSIDDIRIALESGATLIGENKVQELASKYQGLKDIAHDTHFIGHLQSNKIKEVIQYADCIQSIDRVSLAEKLQRRLELEDRTMDVFLQFNTSYEKSKFGKDPINAIPFAKQIKSLDRLNVKGLMTIGLFSSENEKIRKCFQLLRGIQAQILDIDMGANDLSMGMSGDLEIAIEEGATIIRVGKAIFGQRPYPDSYYWNESDTSK